MKRIIAVLLAIIMVFSLSACGGGKTVDFSDVEVGDYIKFGNYNNKEIEWLVLEKTNDRILVISKDVIAQRPYHEEYEEVTWETCTLRSWLNDGFINDAFTESECEMIPTVTVPAGPNTRYATNYGNETEDKVFLLSVDEFNKYFSSDDEPFGGDIVWLRSPGSFQFYAAVVEYGKVDLNGREVYSADYSYDSGAFYGSINYAVRPAMWIEIE